MSSVGDKKIENYLNSVCSLVKNKRVHENIREELLSHIDEIIEDKVSQGKSEKIAIEEAISQMGDYNIVGTKLNKVHKATPDWMLLAMMGTLILVGIITLFSMMEMANYSYGSPYFLINKTIVHVVIGMLIGFIVIRCDYRLLKKYSKITYVMGVLTLLLLIIIGTPVYGIKSFLRIGSISINALALSQLFFVVSLAGIFENYNWSSKKNILIGLLIGFIPSILFLLAPSLTSAVIYIVAISIIMIISGLRIRYLVSFIGAITLTFICWIFNQPYRINRLLELFSFKGNDINNVMYGFIYERLNTIRNSSKLLGQGGQLVQNLLPEVNTDFILVYIIYSFGWIVAIMLITLIIGFIVRIYFVGIKTKDKYGKLITIGFCSIMSVQFLLNILINLNLAPYFSVPMPFISYGGSNLVINIITVTLIISIYKWRNIPYKEKKGNKLKEIF